MSEAPDPLATQLAALAPHVDPGGSRKLFERARAGRSAPRRRLLPAAVSALLVTGLVGVWALASEESATVPATPVERVEPSGGEFELLAVGQTVRTAGTIQYATTAEERESALAPLTDEAIESSIDGSIDLDVDLLVVFNVPGNSCPWRLDRFTVEGTLWTPQFSEVGGDCNDVGVTWAYVVALPRRVLGNSVSFAIPPEFGGGSTLTITFAINGPRTDDLVGYAGNADGGDVQLFLTTATRFDGDVETTPASATRPADLVEIELFDLDVLATTSSTGPIWRLVAATLVVENGVGALCEIDMAVPVLELATCDGDGVDTAVTSDQPEITSWFFGPVLAEFDESGTITSVVPIGGEAARNDGPDGVNAGPSGDGWEQLALVHGPTRSHLPEWAVSSEQYAAMREKFSEEVDVDFPLDVDFSSSVVFAFSRPTGPCPIRLDAVDIEPSSRVTPRFDTTDSDEIVLASLGDVEHLHEFVRQVSAWLLDQH